MTLHRDIRSFQCELARFRFEDIDFLRILFNKNVSASPSAWCPFPPRCTSLCAVREIGCSTSVRRSRRQPSTALLLGATSFLKEIVQSYSEENLISAFPARARRRVEVLPYFMSRFRDWRQQQRCRKGNRTPRANLLQLDRSLCFRHFCGFSGAKFCELKIE